MAENESFHAASPALVAKRLKILDFIESRLRDQRYVSGYADGEMEASLVQVPEARETYRALRDR